MTVSEIVRQSRSYRRFDGSREIGRSTLEALVDLARLSPSGANRQALKYWLSWDSRSNAAVFPHLKWAGYLPDWDGPAPGERPTAYIVIVLDKTLSESPGCDQGIAAQSILLGAVERGMGGCLIGAFDKPALSAVMNLPSTCRPLLVVALGYPAETVIIEEIGPGGDIRYWREEDGSHHVPKRKREHILLN